MIMINKWLGCQEWLDNPSKNDTITLIISIMKPQARPYNRQMQQVCLIIQIQLLMAMEWIWEENAGNYRNYKSYIMR